jgi:putative NIF3 family GTP cyclohydrolase 1 type 2
MKAGEFLDHCKKIASWVDWDNTNDYFMHGSPESDVRGIAVTWLATDAVLREAADMGLNFVVSHEGAFYPAFKGSPSEDMHHERKKELLDKLGITLMRCHDTWDRMPEFGIPDAWAEFLGFPSEPRETGSYYKICLVHGMKASDVAREVLKKTKPLGQSFVKLIGRGEKQVSRLAVGTGAITRLPEMAEMGADIILATDDGIQTTYCGLWSLDLDIPVLVVDHPTSELPGMMKMPAYIQSHFPGIPAKYLPCAFPSPTIMQ